MKKLSKQVLALGLASGVLLSGLPLGNVVDASSKTVGKVGVTKVVKAELTTKQKVAVEKKKFLAYQAAQLKESAKVSDELYVVSRAALDMKKRYLYIKLQGLYDAKLKEISDVRSVKSKLDDKYYVLFYYSEGNDSDAKKLSEYMKLNKSVESLNAQKGYAKVSKDALRFSKDVAGLKKISEDTALASRLKFEKLNTLGYQLMTRNKAWENSINIGAVSGKFQADLIAAGKRTYDAEKLARNLDAKLTLEFSTKVRGAKTRYDSYLRSFNYDPSNNENISGTLRDVDILNKYYKDSQNALSGTVGRAYKDAGLPYVSGTFDLK